METQNIFQTELSNTEILAELNCFQQLISFWFTASVNFHIRQFRSVLRPNRLQKFHSTLRCRLSKKILIT